MAVKRDLAAEQRAVGQFKAVNGNRMPNLNDPKDRANLYRLAYPASGGLPDELKSTVDEGLYAAGINAASTTQPLSQTVAGSNLGQLQNDVTAAQAGIEKTSQPNEALRILQEAIRAKSGQATQPLGTSPIFEKAGLTGIGALNASLAETDNKFQDDFSNFSNTIKQMSGTYKDMADAALNKYKMAYTAFKDESDRLQKIQDDAQQHRDAIDILNQQYQNSVKLEQYKQSHPDIDELLKGEGAGKVLDNNGNWINKSDTVITSPSGNSYDWSTYNAPGGIDYIKDVQAKINSIGKLNNYADLASYINNNMAGSNIQPIDIINASEKTGVGWEELLAILQKESIGGTSNVAKNNNNFGGITWSQSYQDSHPNVTKGSARPANEGGNYVKFKTVEDGLMAQAEQFAKRKVQVNSDPISKLSPLARQVYNGESSMDGITPTEQTKIKKEIANAGLVLKNLSTADKTRIDKIVGQFDNEQTVKNYNTVAEGYNFAKSLSDTSTNSADDQGLIYAFAKAMDPNSAVKEGEYETIRKYAQAWKDTFKFNALRVADNVEFLTPEARKNIKATIKKKFEVSQKQYNNVYNEYGRKVDMISGGNGKDYLVDYSGGNVIQPAFSTTAPDGKTYEFDDQKSLDEFKKKAGIK